MYDNKKNNDFLLINNNSNIDGTALISRMNSKDF